MGGRTPRSGGVGAEFLRVDFMLDTCVINLILDGEVGNEWSVRGSNFVTDIQFQEILDTRDELRRRFLFQGLLALEPAVIRPTDLPSRLIVVTTLTPVSVFRERCRRCSTPLT
jgi:hypothetical protein